MGRTKSRRRTIGRRAGIGAVVGATAAVTIVLAGGAWPGAVLAGLLIAAATAGALGVRAQLARQHTQVERLRKQVTQLSADLEAASAPDPQGAAALATLQRLDHLLDEGIATGAQVAAFERRLHTLDRRSTAQVEAYLQLRDLAPPRGPLPATRGWAASPDYLLELVGVIVARKPRLVVDLGSGLSTVWAALALDHHGIDGRIVAVDSAPEYAERTRALLARHEVSHLAEVRVAPITDVTVGDETFPWYDPAALADLHDVGVVSVDGPPSAAHPMARYPALPLLLPRLTTDAVLLLDDAARDQEKAVVARWHGEHPELTVDTIDLEKGAVRIERGPGQASLLS